MVVVLCSRFYRVVYSKYQHVNANITDASFKIVLLFHMCKGNACLGNSTAAVWEVNELLSDGKDPPPPRLSSLARNCLKRDPINFQVYSFVFV